MDDDSSPDEIRARPVRPSNIITHEEVDEAKLHQQQTHVMQEEEVREIMAEFNRNMNNVLAENEDLKSQMTGFTLEKREIEEKLNTLIEEQKVLSEEKRHFQELSNQYEEKLKLKDKEFVDVEMNKIAAIKDNSTGDEITQYRETITAQLEESEHRDSLLDMLNNYEKMKQDMIQLSVKFEHLAKENEKLKEEVHKESQEQNILRGCARCHEMFSPLINNEQACVYHSGKLKYYSCRGCGADEYWSCCNKCSTCLKGCREGKHLSV